MLVPYLVLSLSRWPIPLVLPSMWLLLQEPQGRRRGRERHLLQRALHLQLWEPVRSQLSPGNSHLRPGQPPVTPPRQRPNPWQAAEKGPHRHAPAVRTAAEEWLAAHAYGELPRHQHLQEKAGKREADGRGGAGKVHSRLPQDQDPREVPREEVHVAGRPVEKVPPLSQDTGSRHMRPRISLQVFWSWLLQWKGDNTKLIWIQFPGGNFTFMPVGWKSTQKLERSIKTRLFSYWHM